MGRRFMVKLLIFDWAEFECTEKEQVDLSICHPANRSSQSLKIPTDRARLCLQPSCLSSLLHVLASLLQIVYK